MAQRPVPMSPNTRTKALIKMSEPQSGSFTAEDLTDPNIDPRTLQQLSADRPDLWPNILHHPNCYPSLVDYIKTQMQPPSPPGDSAGDQAQSQPQPQQTTGAGEHFSAGAKKAVSDARDYWANTAGPAVSGASKNAQATMSDNKNNWRFWVCLGQPVLALIAFITLFTPAVRVLDAFNLEGGAEGLAEEMGLSDELDSARDELGLHTSQNFITHDMTAAGVMGLLKVRLTSRLLRKQEG